MHLHVMLRGARAKGAAIASTMTSNPKQDALLCIWHATGTPTSPQRPSFPGLMLTAVLGWRGQEGSGPAAAKRAGSGGPEGAPLGGKRAELPTGGVQCEAAMGGAARWGVCPRRSCHAVLCRAAPSH